ncbi:MAG: dihydrofolate reductase [Bacillota bacterium]
MSLSIMVAMDKNRLIGKDNALPWHFKEDLKYFKRVTSGHTVLMGRKTFESIRASLGGPLPGRKNLVLSRSLDTLDGAEVIHDATAYFKKAAQKDEEIFVIGGAEVFKAALPYANKLYITSIDAAYEGDTYFPDVDLSAYEKTQEETKGPLTFTVYERTMRS